MAANDGEQTNQASQEQQQQSPDELGKMVEALLENMQSKFQLMSEQIIGRLDEMGNRVDDLEKNISELMEQLEAKDDVKKEQQK